MGHPPPVRCPTRGRTHQSCAGASNDDHSDASGDRGGLGPLRLCDGPGSPVPGPPAAPTRPPAPRPEEQVVQAPAREALELIEGSRRPEPAASASRHATPPAASPQEEQRRSGTRDARPHPARPEHRPPAPRSPQRPPADLPDVSESVRQDVHKNVPKNADVCALGKRFGGGERTARRRPSAVTRTGVERRAGQDLDARAAASAESMPLRRLLPAGTPAVRWRPARRRRTCRRRGRRPFPWPVADGCGPRRTGRA